MSVFYVHDITKRLVTPLDRRYYVREIPQTTETEEITPISSNQDRSPSDERNRNKALQSYREASGHASPQEGTSAEAKIQLGKVRDIMTRKAISAKQSESIADAWQMMARHTIHHLAILDEQNFLCGFVSESDLLDQLVEHADEPADNILLENFCREDVVSAGPETDVKTLADFMLLRGIDGLPVTENGDLAGVVTSADILKQLLATRAFDSKV